MKNDNEHLGTMAILLEVGIVIIMCMVLLIRQHAGQSEKKEPVVDCTPSVTVAAVPTPTERPTETPTVTPTDVPSPTWEPQLTIREWKTYTIKPVDSGHTYKPFTRYTSYNIPNSAQYKLQKIARTAENGVRVVTDPEGRERYCVALGTYWAGAHPEHIGRCIDVVMVNGTVLPCVLADVKKTQDTKRQQNKYGQGNNDVLEFIVDMKVLPEAARICGNCSRISPAFEGDVKEMIVYDWWIEGFGK